VLAAGQETSFSVQWDQKDTNGLLVMGRYYLDWKNWTIRANQWDLDLPSPVYFPNRLVFIITALLFLSFVYITESNSEGRKDMKRLLAAY